MKCIYKINSTDDDSEVTPGLEPEEADMKKSRNSCWKYVMQCACDVKEARMTGRC